MVDFENVALCFRQLSRCSDEKFEEVKPLVTEALNAVKDALDFDRVTASEVSACEYAAACLALYDYVCREVSCEQITVTAVGNADNIGDITHRLKGAEELKKEALRRIAGLMRSESFLFETI